MSKPPLYSNIAAVLNFDRLSELSDIKPGSSEGVLFKDTKRINLESSGKKKKKFVHKLSYEQQTPKQKSIEKFYSSPSVRPTKTPVPILLPRKKSKKSLKKSSKITMVSDLDIPRQPTMKEILAMDQAQPAWIKNPVRFLNDKTRFVYEMKTIQNL